MRVEHSVLPHEKEATAMSDGSGSGNKAVGVRR